jgi:hypothetical protein
MRRAPYVVIVVSFAAALTAVACAARTHKALVVFDATALAAVQSIGQVEVSLSSAGLLTPQQSLTIRRKLTPVIAVGESATLALMAWTPGQPIPSDLLALSTAMGALLKDVVAMLPHDSPAKVSLLTAIATAQSAWADIVRIIVGGQT